MNTSRKWTLCALALSVALGGGGIAKASCTGDSAQQYADIDRLVLVRCKLVPAAYPCYRATVEIQDGRIIHGDLNSIKQNPLHGKFALSQDNARDVIATLQRYGSLDMTVPPAEPAIDGELEIVAMHFCGTAKTLRTFGATDDSGHAQWNSLLRDLQASTAALHWVRISSTPDYKEPAEWFKPGAELELLHPR